MLPVGPIKIGTHLQGDAGTAPAEGNTEIVDPRRVADSNVPGATPDHDNCQNCIPPTPTPQFHRAIVPVDSITVEETFGRELDDAYVTTLATIVERYGLRDSITATPDLRLLSGQRWLAAVQRLGRPEVEVVIVEVTS